MTHAQRLAATRYALGQAARQLSELGLDARLNAGDRDALGEAELLVRSALGVLELLCLVWRVPLVHPLRGGWSWCPDGCEPRKAGPP